MEGFKRNVRFFPFIQYPNSSLMAYILHIKLTNTDDALDSAETQIPTFEWF